MPRPPVPTNPGVIWPTCVEPWAASALSSASRSRSGSCGSSWSVLWSCSCWLLADRARSRAGTAL